MEYKKEKKFILLVLILALLSYCSPKEGKVEKTMIDGVTHIMNPEIPLKGVVQLEIEKTREINPYLHEEVGLRYLSFIRDEDDEVILFDSGNAEAQMFNRNGDYKGNLFRKGQGPGEFQPRRMFNVCFMNNQIWATGDMKFAKYDKDGKFLYERRIDYRPDIFVDENTFFINKRERKEGGQVTKISLVNLSSDKNGESSIIDFFQGENVGFIQRKDGRAGFWDPWGVPDIKFDYDQENQRFYVGLNTEYNVYVKNLKGEILYVIERPYKYVKVNSEDKKKLLPWAAKEESQKWALSVYPDILVTFKDIKILPNGYLAVYRVSGVETIEVDIFDQEGRYVYIMKPPEGVSLDDVIFYNFGFAIKETEEDGLEVYAEYKIKNLPDIFQ